MRLTGILAAATLLASSTGALAAPAANPAGGLALPQASTPLTQPAAEAVSGDSALVGGTGLIAALAAAAAIAGIVAVATHHHDQPNSP